MAAIAMAAGGAILGGLGGFLGSGKAPELQKAKKINSFKGTMGTAKPDGFVFSQDANRQAAVDSSNLGLKDLLAGGLAIDPNRLKEYQNAFVDARRPSLERDLAQQQQQANVQQSVRGASGGSAALFQNALLGQRANEQRSNLLNQAILGRESLANQALQQKLAQGQFLGNLSQQDIGNRLNAQNTTLQNLFGSQQNELAYTNSINQVADANAANAKANDKWGNALSGAIGGASAGMSLGSSFGGGSGGMSAFSAPSSSSQFYGNSLNMKPVNWSSMNT